MQDYFHIFSHPFNCHIIGFKGG